MRSRAKRLCVPLALFAFTNAALAWAQDASAVPGQIVQVAELNSLNTVQLKPWHLKASYARFDTAQSEIDGTLEMWWAGKDRARIETTEADRKSVYLLTAQQRLRSSDSAHLSQAMEMLVHMIEQPFPADLTAFSQPAQEQSFGDVTMRCYVRQSGTANPDQGVVAGVMPAFCVDQSNALRVVSQPGLRITCDDVRSFEGHDAPGKVTVSFGDHLMLHAQVNELTEAPDANVSMATDGFVPDVFTGPVRISGGMMAGQILTRVQPMYPVGARKAHVTGTVIFAARIGKNGRIADLKVVSSPDKLLTEAATDAVRQWRYRPYLLNGVPAEVNTTITINFNLN